MTDPTSGLQILKRNVFEFFSKPYLEILTIHVNGYQFGKSCSPIPRHSTLLCREIFNDARCIPNR